MQKLEHIRHSLAHLLAAAVLEKYPEAKLGVGPVIESGFYYDIHTEKPISADDLPALEDAMRRMLGENLSFDRIDATPDQARAQFAHQPMKIELINDLEKEGAAITLYQTGAFIDLCRGGHVEKTSEIPGDAFKLDKTAGAYWRGDEKNQMLTRIYGLAFLTKEDLDAHLVREEEARKRDHRKLGRELDLFTFSELVGPGLPLFTPKGTVLRHELEDFVWSLMEPYGYQRVNIPHMAKVDLYKTSGHYEKFADDIFFVASKETPEAFIMKPMNCPHHTQIYASRPRSYRDLPLRFSEVTTVYRDEKAGQLAGLTRVRSITQDDAHVFATPEQVEKEVAAIYDIITRFYKVFDMPLSLRLSVNDPEHPENYLGDPAIWERSVETLKKLIASFGKEYYLGVGEAAFYGPKIDFIAKDAIGREWQLATVQLDFNLPERFELEYTDADGTKKRPVMIHRAISGSLERFIGVLIEHYAGAFPLWIAPVGVRVLPVGEAHQAYAAEVLAALRASGIRAEMDAAGDSLGKRIREAKMEKIPYLFVVGDAEKDAHTVSVESRSEKVGVLPLTEAITLLKKNIEERS